MANRGGAPMIPILLLLLLLSSASASLEKEVYVVPVKTVVYRPPSWTVLPATTTTATKVVSSSYEPFELCQGCRCCSSSNASSCVDTSCCYAINCNLPGKPFGTCAFTPHTCGCGGGGAASSGNCTRPS